jgi:hypothetical protein
MYHIGCYMFPVANSKLSVWPAYRLVQLWRESEQTPLPSWWWFFRCPLGNTPHLNPHLNWLSASQSKSCVLVSSTHLGFKTRLFFCLTVAGLLTWGALCDERTSLSFTLHNVQYIYILHVYVCIIYSRLLSVQAQYSRSCPIFGSSRLWILLHEI